MPLEAFFFPTAGAARLMGVWRGPRDAERAWLLCPPFAEEEKSARRVLTLLAQKLEARGESSLVFSFRGTGDSDGDFAASDLASWREDLHAARDQVTQRAPRAALGLLGVRLGASLALQEAEALGATRLVLIEPLLSGRSFLMQMGAKRQIRAQLTGEGSPISEGAPTSEGAPISANGPVASALPADDFDGWPLGERMKAGLRALDLKMAPPVAARTFLFQVGPRAEVAPPLQQLATRLGASCHAVVMPPFWNLLDFADPTALLSDVDDAIFGA